MRPARCVFFILSTCLAAACLTAAITFDSLEGPDILLRHWPDYYRAMADREPHREHDWLMRLLAIEPRDSAAQTRLAANAEWRGDLETARAILERAARHDARYRVQWAKLQFEVRHGSPGIWDTARRCLAMSYGDRRAPLETLWQLRPDGAFLLSTVVPDSPPVLFYLTAFLMEQGDLVSARQAFARLIVLPVGSASRANAGLVGTALERAHLGLDLTDLHLDRRDPQAALGIWQSLAGRHLVEVDGAAEAGRQVMNSRFLTEPIGRGFDWRVIHSPGVEMRRVEGGWRVDFTANRPPDQLMLLEQRVILTSGKAVLEVETNAPAWVRATVVEESPGVARLRIEYRRAPGQPHWREPLVIRQVRWRKV